MYKFVFTFLNFSFPCFNQLFHGWQQVTTEDYSSTEVPVGSDDRESYTLHGLNDVYENVNVADNRTADVER
jgi:hypothetical protein